MLVDLRLSKNAAERSKDGALAATSAVVRALADGAVDASSVRVECDWIQYRNNFREPIALRQVLGRRRRGTEVAIDLRQLEKLDADAALSSVLASDPVGVVHLEPWLPLSESCIWRFNALYWSELALWEEVSGKGYEQALPGGASGGTDTEANRDLILGLFKVWDGLAQRRSLPEQLTVLELGVGNGNQARTWLEQFVRIDHEMGTDYYRRLHYLMGDYSKHVLDLARANVSEFLDRTSTLALDAARPSDTLRFLEKKIFFVYISNVYDNLPTDEIVCLDDELYRVEVRAFLPASRVASLVSRLGSKADISDLVAKLLKFGPTLLAETSEPFSDPVDAGRFWQEVWSGLRLEERYVPLGALDLYRVCEGVSAELIDPCVDGFGDVRFHMSNGAAASFVDTLPLLHPLGSLVCHDLFVTDLDQYRVGFRGPGKYEGSVVNWVNGPVLAAIASRFGYHATFDAMEHGSNRRIVTMTARSRD